MPLAVFWSGNGEEHNFAASFSAAIFVSVLRIRFPRRGPDRAFQHLLSDPCPSASRPQGRQMEALPRQLQFQVHADSN